MLTAKEILEIVNAYIYNLPYDRKPQSLYEPIEYVLSLGGKRIRPSLMLMAYNMYNDDPEKILPLACAIETYHNFTLLHDDLMDNASMRRGHQTVHEKWNANTAILSGDTMLVLAFQRMTQCPPDKLKAVLDLFIETTLQIGDGQQYDMDFEERTDVTEEEYIEMIRLKTSVLLACSLKIGALLADAQEKDAENLYKFGEQLGLAFQLQDDYLDVYGDPAVFGKAIGGDILCNKKTFMLINAFNRAEDTMKKEIMKWVTAETFNPKEKIAAVTDIYNKLCINLLAEEKIEYYFAQSRKYLTAVNVSDERKAVLTEYTNKMMNRKY
ncbi:MAG: polyprenyl synthetase family protein [Prevotella sp.]|nr:polyprenyl synthetase family protein [Prevotella sp.]